MTEKINQVAIEAIEGIVAAYQPVKTEATDPPGEENTAREEIANGKSAEEVANVQGNPDPAGTEPPIDLIDLTGEGEYVEEELEYDGF